MAFSVEQALQYLKRARDHDRLAHAYLLSGNEHRGRNALVHDFYAAVNGASANLSDFHEIEPESKSRKILVEQIRTLEGALRMRAASASLKFGIVNEADRLMPQAANAFLKTLEEPPLHCILFLLTDLPEALLETIRSRCIQVSLKEPNSLVLTEEERNLLDAVSSIVLQEGFSLRSALRLVRIFQDAEANSRQKIEAEHEIELKKLRALYHQTTDGVWLENQEERLTVLTESRYVKARSSLVARLLDWFGDAIRIQNDSLSLDLDHYHGAAAKLAGKATSLQLLNRMQGLQRLLDLFGKNVQEVLAIEVCFLQAFGPGE